MRVARSIKRVEVKPVSFPGYCKCSPDMKLGPTYRQDDTLEESSPDVMKLLKAKELLVKVHFAYLLDYNCIEVYNTARWVIWDPRSIFRNSLGKSAARCIAFRTPEGSCSLCAFPETTGLGDTMFNGKSEGFLFFCLTPWPLNYISEISHSVHTVSLRAIK